MSRPRIFMDVPCPECGATHLLVYSTSRRGFCLNRWCKCEKCGATVRFIKTDKVGFWTRVKKWPETLEND